MTSLLCCLFDDVFDFMWKKLPKLWIIGLLCSQAWADQECLHTEAMLLGKFQFPFIQILIKWSLYNLSDVAVVCAKFF